MVTSLKDRFGDQADDAQLTELARQAVAHYRHARVTNYLPILARRHALELAEGRFGPPTNRSPASTETTHAT